MKYAKDLVEQLLPTLYEDAHILVVDKPSGIDTGDVEHGRGDGVVELLSELRGATGKLRVTNRLSRYESGILILAKDPAIARSIRTDWKRHQVRQQYLAVVLGKLTKSKIVADGESHSAVRLERRPASTTKARGAKGVPTASKTSAASSKTKSATESVISTVWTGARRTVVRCSTTANNTHLLRAQLRSVRLRLLGDKLHEPDWRARFENQTCLHLAKVTLCLPGRKSGTVVTSPQPEFFMRIAGGSTDMERPLRAAVTRRLPFILRRESNAFRVLCGDREDLRGLVIERFGPIAILQVYSERPELEDKLPEIARWTLQTLGLEAAYVKRFVRDRVEMAPEVRADMSASKPLAGKAVAPEIEVMERGIRFLIRPYDGFAVGLYLDQRDNRGRVRAMAAGRDVLNLFAYTCGFSVAAALGGARSVTSVDLSSKHLEWGKNNFQRNGLDPAAHQWFRSDAVEATKRMRKQARLFDLVILDPPTFAHGRKSGRTFSIERDLGKLIGDCVAFLRPGGALLISTNHRRMTMERLRNQFRMGARGRQIRSLVAPPPPADFVKDPGASKSLIVHFE